MYRIGYGVDFHRFVEGRKLVLGGVEVPFGRGLDGHSDADVILHAVCDALLGAACLGDIGEHFPDTDPRYKGVASTELLKATALLIRDKGWSVVNVDLTLVLQAPKIAVHKPRMREIIASFIGCESVNIKATTPEHLGALGRGEGAECRAVVMLRSLSDS
jgi:2-C-methyl-D-erythritol 2,4-cyclodiphosphate synthase